MAEFDVEYDVVCIGSGAAGKSAAYIAAKEGGLSVVVLEKMPQTGGTSIYAEGICASESIEQQTRPHPDYPGPLPEGAHFPTHEEHVQRYIDYSHHRANLDVVKAFVYNSPETISMYKEMGIEFSDVTIYAWDQDLELYTFHRPEGLGAKCQELLLRACENAGVDFFTSTPAKELIKEDGKIVGVVATDADGNELSIGAKAVVIATGGFGNNMDMVRKYSWMPQLADTNYQSFPTENTGDGILMAEAAGAHLKDIGTLMVDACALGSTLDSGIEGGGFQPNLWVDSRGMRFVNEAVSQSFADTGNTVAMRDDGIVFSVLDSASVKRLETDGSVIGLGDFIPIHQTLPTLSAEIAENIGTSCFKGDTIEELAEGMGVDVETFTAVVEKYNAACEAGVDEEFRKPAKFLYPITQPPFYAIRMAPTILVSCGGIRINGNFQVTDDKYIPIPGLYAAGMDATGLYGDTYNLDCPGTANGFAHTSGRQAARHIIETLSK